MELSFVTIESVVIHVDSLFEGCDFDWCFVGVGEDVGELLC